MRVFLSHTWRPDCLGRPTHDRVTEVGKALQRYGHTVWIDQERLVQDIDHCMADGIDNCDIFAVFLTHTYVTKVCAAASDPGTRDNCYKEFSYAQSAQKVMLPVAFEPCMLTHANWPGGIVKMHLGQRLYVDGANSSSEAIARDMDTLMYRGASLKSPRTLPPITRVDTPKQYMVTDVPHQGGGNVVLPAIVDTPKQHTVTGVPHQGGGNVVLPPIKRLETVERAVQTCHKKRWLLVACLIRFVSRLRKLSAIHSSSE